MVKESALQVEQDPIRCATGDALKMIISGVEVTAGKITEIVAATVHQATNATEVSEAIGGVAGIVEQSAAGSQEMASNSEELGAQAARLRDLVDHFTLSETTAS